MGFIAEQIMAAVAAMREVDKVEVDLTVDPEAAFEHTVQKNTLHDKHYFIMREAVKDLTFAQIDLAMKQGLDEEQYRAFLEQVEESVEANIWKKPASMSRDVFMRQYAEEYMSGLAISLFKENDEILEGFLIGLERLTPNAIPDEKIQGLFNDVMAFHVPGDGTPEEIRRDPHGDRIDALLEGISAEDPRRQALTEALERSREYLAEPSDDYRQYQYKKGSEEEKIASEADMAIAEKTAKTMEGGRFAGLPFSGNGPGSALDAPFSDEQAALQDELFSRSYTLTDDYKTSLSRMLHKMDEIYGVPADTLLPAEEQTKIYGFRNLLPAKAELEAAIESGDPDAILAAEAKYSKARSDMLEFYSEVQDHFTRDFLFPGNVDVLRTEGVPLEFTAEKRQQSRINGVYSVYVFAHNNHLDPDQLLADPQHQIEKFMADGLEEQRPATRAEGRSTGTDLAAIVAHSAGSGKNQALLMRNHVWMSGSRTLEAIAFGEPDREKRAQMEFQARQLSRTMQTRMMQIMDEEHFFDLGDHGAKFGKRRSEMYQYLAIADRQDVDFAAFSPTDRKGRKNDPPTLEQYLSDTTRTFDYAKIARQGRELVGDFTAEARKQGFRDTDAIATDLAVSTRVAQVKLLLSRQADRDQPGFEALEQEILTMGDDLSISPGMSPKTKETLKKLSDVYREARDSMAKDEKSLEETVRKTDGKLNDELQSLTEKLAHAEREKQLGNHADRNAAEADRLRAEIAKKAGSRLDELNTGYRKGKVPEQYFRQRAKQLHEILEKGRIDGELPPLFADERERGAFLGPRAARRAGLPSDVYVKPAAAAEAMRAVPRLTTLKAQEAAAATNDRERDLLSAEKMLAVERAVEQLKTKKKGPFSKDTPEYTALLESSQKLLDQMHEFYEKGATLTGEERRAAVNRLEDQMIRVRSLADQYADLKDKGGKKHSFTTESGATRYLAAKSLSGVAADADRIMKERVSESAAKITNRNPEARNSYLGLDPRFFDENGLRRDMESEVPRDQKAMFDRIKALDKKKTGELMRGSGGGLMSLCTLTFMKEHPELDLMQVMDQTKFQTERRAVADRVLTAIEKAQKNPADYGPLAQIVGDGIRTLNHLDLRKNTLAYLGVQNPESLSEDQTRAIFDDPANREKIATVLSAQGDLLLGGYQALQYCGVTTGPTSYGLIDFSKTGEAAAADIFPNAQGRAIQEKTTWINTLMAFISPQDAAGFKIMQENAHAFPPARTVKDYLTGENRHFVPEDIPKRAMQFQALMDQVAAGVRPDSEELVLAVRAAGEFTPDALGISPDTSVNTLLRDHLTPQQTGIFRAALPQVIPVERQKMRDQQQKMMKPLMDKRAARAREEAALQQEIATAKRGRRMSVSEVSAIQAETEGRAPASKDAPKQPAKKLVTRTRARSLSTGSDTPTMKQNG